MLNFVSIFTEMAYIESILHQVILNPSLYVNTSISGIRQDLLPHCQKCLQMVVTFKTMNQNIFLNLASVVQPPAHVETLIGEQFRHGKKYL
ncbi:hypothetical protein HZS_3214 [Henneguya salminicola]|nr:hypothetical protein HZS_3214 [Henneguya salminicola]